MRPVAQRVGEWASASRTFSAITDLLASFGVGLLSWLPSFSNLRMLHLLLPACLLRYSTEATFSPTRHHHRRRLIRGGGAPCRPTLRRRVEISPRLLVERYRHPLSPILCDKAKTPEQCSCSGKAPVFGGHTLGTSSALAKIKPSTFFMRRDFDEP